MKNVFQNLVLSAAALAIIVFAVAPASAAKVKAVGCSADSIAKAASIVDGLPDTDANKLVGHKEMTDANQALVNGKMGECAMHVNKVMHMGMTKPAS
jgi:hypothetical protein